MPVFDVYSRRGCHLCEVLIEQLSELVHGRAEIEVHDIDSRADWRQRYDDLVPVVEFGGERLCKYRLDADAEKRVLARLAGDE